jgi:acyl carrier protein
MSRDEERKVHSGLPFSLKSTRSFGPDEIHPNKRRNNMPDTEDKDLEELKARYPALGDVFIRLRKLVAERLEIPESKIRVASSIRGDLGADSLDTYELIYMVEEELGISIPDQTAMGFETVKDALEFIQSKLDEKKLSGAEAS